MKKYVLLATLFLCFFSCNVYSQNTQVVVMDGHPKRYDFDTRNYIDTLSESYWAPFDQCVTIGDNNIIYTSGHHIFSIISGYSRDVIFSYDGTTGDYIGSVVTFPDNAPRVKGLAYKDGQVYYNQNGGLTLGPDGNLYSSWTSSGKIFQEGLAGLFDNEFINSTLVSPLSLTFGPDGNLYVADSADDLVKRFDGTTGAYIDAFVYSSAHISEIGSIQFGPDNDLYVLSKGTDEILRYDGTTGDFVEVFLSTADGLNSNTQAFTFAPLPAAVPEPAAMMLFPLGLFIAGLVRKKRSN